jgi:hypothetical protein
MKNAIFAFLFLIGCTTDYVSVDTQSQTGTKTDTNTGMVQRGPAPTETNTQSNTNTVSNTVTQVVTNTQTATVTQTATDTHTSTITQSVVDTSSTTNTQTSTATQTNTATAPTPINLCLRPDLLTPGSPVSSDELMAGLASGFYYYADVAPGVCGDAIPIALCPNPIPGGPSVICPNMDTNFFFQCPSVTSNGTQNCQSQQNVRCGFCKKICNRC